MSERVVRIRIEQVGAEGAARGAAVLETQLDKAAVAEAKLAREARPAATSVDRLRDAEGRLAKAAGDAAPKVDKLGKETAETGREAAAAAPKLDKAKASATGFGDAAEKIGGKLKTALLGFLSFQAVKGFLTQAIDAISEAEATTALLGARVVATGGMAERSVAQIEAAASRFSAALGVDDEAVAKAADSLLQYDRVASGVFDRTIKMALDMAAGTEDAAGSAEFLGKVLQDVEEGLPLLNRQWKLFSDAEEEAIVKLARAGKTVEAQTAVLDAMERRVGGAAAAWRDTLPGAISAASVEWENQLELLQQGLSPAVRKLAEDFVAWSQSAEGQQRIIELGEELGTVIANVEQILDKLVSDLADIDPSRMAELVNVVLDLGSGLATVVSWINKIGEWTPSGLIVNGLLDALRAVKENAADAVDMLHKLDPRAMAGSTAGVVASAAPGMTPAQRKAWEEEEAAWARDVERKRRADEDARHRAAEDAKRTASAVAAAEQLVAAVREEESARKTALEILKQEGKSREDLEKQYRAAEIAAKADAKVADIRAAFLKAGKKWTDELAASLRASVIASEEFADSAKKWLSIKPPAHLKPIEIPVRPKLVGLEVVTDEMEWVISQLDKIETVRQSNEDAFAAARDDVDAQLLDQALFFKESLATPHEEFERFNRQIDELAKVTDDAGNKILSAADAERLRAQAAEQYATQQLDMWVGFLQEMGDALGGFVAQVADLASSVQRVNSTAQGMGGWGSAAGAWGGTIAAFVAAYQYADSVIQKHKGQKYGTVGSVDRTGGFDVLSYSGNTRSQLGKADLDLARAIQGGIEALEDALRIGISDLGKIEIKVRNDGKSVQAWVEGLYLGTFSDVNEAIRAAAIEALRSAPNAAGLSDLMKQGLASYSAPDPEGLIEFLQALRQISDLSLSAGAIDLQQKVHQLEEMWAVLGHLPALTPEVLEGYQNLGSGIVQAWQDWADSVSGRQKTQAELEAAKQRDVAIFEQQKKLFLAEQRLRVLDLKDRLAALIAKGNATRAEGIIDGAGVKEKEKLLEAELSLAQAEAGVASERIALIQEQIKAIEGIIAEIEGISAEIGEGGPKGGGHLGGPNLKDLREGLREEIKRLQAEAKGPLHAAFFDFQQSLRDFRERAKEAKLSAEETAAGIATLTAAFQSNLRAQAKERAGIGTDFTRTLEDTLKFFDELRDLGRDKTGMPKWLIDLYEGKAIAKLGMQLQQSISEFSGMADPMLAINIQAEELRTNLLAYAQAAGWSAEQIAEAMAQIEGGVEFQRQQGINSLMDRLFAWMQQAGIQTEESVEHERQKALLDLQIIEAQLRFYGALSEQASAWIGGVRDWINSDAFGLKGAASGLSGAARDLSSSASDQLKGWRDWVQRFRQGFRDFVDASRDRLTNEAVTGLTQQQQLDAARARMQDLAARARAGDLEALRLLSAATDEFLAEARESFQGGTGDPEAWAEAMALTADILTHGQEMERSGVQAYIAAALAEQAQNTDLITTAVYESGRMVADAIYASIGGVPAYAAGGYVNRPHLAMVGEVPEFIIPEIPGMRGGVGIRQMTGPPSRSNPREDRHYRRIETSARESASTMGSVARSAKITADATKTLAQRSNRRRGT